MVAHVLAVLLGLSSVMFYVAAFFYPEVHRRSDIFLSGAGMLYAVLLWFCAGQMTLVVALSQMIAIALLMCLGWQTLSIRREKTPVYQQTPVSLTPEVVGDWAKNTINQLRIAPVDKVRPLRPQNPSLNGTSADRFRQPIDPRRRPVYDYEFVEDGIVADAPAEAVVEDVTALVEAVPDGVPPSAEAEVLVAEVPEAKTPQIENVQGAITDVTNETISTEEIVSETDSASEIDIVMDCESVENESIENESIENEPTDESNDWGFLAADDDFDSGMAAESVSVSASQADALRRSDNTAAQPPAASESPQRLSQAPMEKPAIWAMPIILVGWVKDLVTSMTKPKPSKPMIEIPRREPGQDGTSRVANNVVSSVANEPTDTPISNAAVRASSPSSRDSQEEDDLMTDSNDDIFDDFNQANWVERAEDMPKVVVNDRADAIAHKAMEESNWDD